MKLSDAMRAGAKMGPQGFGAPKQRRDQLSLCAIQAVFMATRGRGSIYEQYPILDRNAGKCPECGGRLPNLTVGIIHLNDDHRWTREAIADWIEATFEGGTRVAQPEPVEELVGA